MRRRASAERWPGATTSTPGLARVAWFRERAKGRAMNHSLAAGNPARTRNEDAIGTPPECPTLVPAECYYSPAFAALEIERMWPKVWQVACMLDHVAEAGDYFE